MDKEIVTYFGIDFGDVGKTAYGLYDPETGKFHEISEEEYQQLIEYNTICSRLAKVFS